MRAACFSIYQITYEAEADGFQIGHFIKIQNQREELNKLFDNLFSSPSNFSQTDSEHMDSLETILSSEIIPSSPTSQEQLSNSQSADSINLTVHECAQLMAGLCSKPKNGKLS